MEGKTRPVIGCLVGSDRSRLPEDPQQLSAQAGDTAGNNDLARLIDAARFEAVPLLIAPNYLSRRWRYDLARYDCIVSLMSDADTNPTSLMLACSLLAAADVPVINDPRHVVRSRPDMIGGLLQGLAGLVVPRTVRLDGAAAGKAIGDAGLRFPVHVRGHAPKTGSREPVLAGTASEVDAAFADGRISSPAYATEFHDFRDSDGLYRSIGMAVIGRNAIVRHVRARDRWPLDAGADAFMATRPDLVDQEREAMAIPRAYMPPRTDQLMMRIRNRLGLDCIAVEFARLADGNLLLLGAGPTMATVALGQDRQRRPQLAAAINNMAASMNALIAERIGEKTPAPSGPLH